MRGAVWLVCLVGCGRIAFEPLDVDPDGGSGVSDGGDAGVAGAVTWIDTQTAVLAMSGGPTVSLAAPTGCSAGDVLVATVAVGSTGLPAPPIFTAPAGWTLIRRLDSDTDTTSAMYWHLAGTSEPASYAWMFDHDLGGVAWLACYRGVDRTSPIDGEDGIVISSGGPSYAAPTITTTVANAVLLATFSSHGNSGAWTAPPTTTTRANLDNGSTRSGIGVELTLPDAGPSGDLTAIAPSTQDYALVQIVALAPGT